MVCRIRILLVEDNDGDAVLMEELLSDCPIEYALERADRLSTAVRLLQEEAFDVVFTDLSLPDASGHDIVRQVFAVRPDVPVIVLSGMMPEALEEVFTDSGARCVIRKGEVDSEQLWSAMKTFVCNSGS